MAGGKDKPMKIMRYIAGVALMVSGCMVDSGTWVPAVVAAAAAGFLLEEAWRCGLMKGGEELDSRCNEETLLGEDQRPA